MENAYPAAFHPSDPWRTTGSCWTLEGEKGNKMRVEEEEGSSFGKTLHSYVICRGLRCRPLTSRLVH